MAINPGNRNRFEIMLSNCFYCMLDDHTYGKLSSYHMDKHLYYIAYFVCISTEGKRKMRAKAIGQHLNSILRNLLYFLLSHSFQFFCQNT